MFLEITKFEMRNFGETSCLAPFSVQVNAFLFIQDINLISALTINYCSLSLTIPDYFYDQTVMVACGNN